MLGGLTIPREEQDDLNEKTKRAKKEHTSKITDEQISIALKEEEKKQEEEKMLFLNLPSIRKRPSTVEKKDDVKPMVVEEQQAEVKIDSSITTTTTKTESDIAISAPQIPDIQLPNEERKPDSAISEATSFESPGPLKV